MLERINGLPAELTGLRATGTVSKEDYERVVRPLLEGARREGRRIRLLFHFGPEFEGFTTAAAWEDLRVGWQYLRLFERCAVVSDKDWIRTATRVVGPALPCPVRVFGNGAREEAVEWLRAAPGRAVDFRILADRGVVVVEPRGKLSPGDFDALEAAVDDWIEGPAGALNGIVVHAREFPGWENLGSVWRHIRFVRDHHRRIARVAFASDSKVAGLAPTLAQPFVKAEVERFEWDALDEAIRWASGEQTVARQAGT
jgi:hypothetical protein